MNPPKPPEGLSFQSSPYCRGFLGKLACRLILGTLLGIGLSAPAIDLLARWTFDDSLGSAVAADATGHFPGALNGGASIVEGGVVGNALELRVGESGYAAMGDVLPMENRSFSVCLWMKVPQGDTSALAALFSRHRPGYPNGYYLLLNQNGTPIAGFTGNTAPFPQSSQAINDGKWHHIAMVHDLNSTTRLYVDGSPSGTPSPAQAGVASPAQFLLGGLDAQPAQGTYNGKLDDVQFYDSALTGNQVNYLYRNPSLTVFGSPQPVQISPATGTYEASANVQLLQGDPGYVLRYTVDGTDPKPTSTEFLLPFRVTTTSIVKAAAFLNGTQVGNAVGAFYTILPGRAPSITTPPKAATVFAGARVALSVEATGTPPLTYTWYKNNQGITGMSSSTMEIFPASAADVADYRVKVSSDFGSALTDPVGVKVKSTVSNVLLAQWEFEDPAGPVVADSNGQFPGRLSATGATLVPGGVSGRAVALKAGQNGFVTIGNTLPLLGQSYSFSLWVKTAPGESGLDAALLSKHRQGNPNGYFVGLNIGGNTVSAFTGNESQFARTSDVVADSAWHHIVVVFDESRETRLYVDGKYTGLSSVAKPTLSSPAEVMLGGFDNAPQKGTYTGLMDDVQIYGFALSDSLVSYLKQHPGSAIPPALLPTDINISPASGNYVESVTVSMTLRSAFDDAVLRYTKDGTDPTASSPEYTGPFTLTSTALVKAAAFRGSTQVGIATGAFYTIEKFILPYITSITSQPQPATAIAGNRVVLSVSAAGTPPLSYLWFKDDQPLSKKTSPTLELDPLRWSDGGIYRAQVSNARGNALSDPVQVVVSPPSGELLAYWRFDEEGGRVASEVTGRYPGLLSISDVALAPGGISGNALSLQGGFAAMGDVLPMLDASFTISAWAKVAVGDTTPIAALVAKHRQGTPNGYYILFNLGADTVSGFTGNEAVFPHTQEGVNDGQWHHIAMTHQKNGEVQLYIDGHATGDPTPAGSTRTSPAQLLIGGLEGGLANSGPVGTFRGMLDDIQIYGFALIAPQVAHLHDNPGVTLLETAVRVTISPAGGSFLDSVKVTLERPGTDTVIRYTLDGTYPTAASPEYTVPFTLISSATVRAATFRNGVIAGSYSSAFFFLEQSKAPTISKQPLGGIGTAGNRLTLNVVASGTPTPTYAWLKNDQPLPGATSSSLDFYPLKLTDSGTYRVRVSNSKGSVLSNPAVVLVSEPQGELLAHWKFDEEAGTLASDTTGHYPGLLSSGANRIPDGVAGRALSLQSGKGGYAYMGDVLPLVGQSYSMSLWFMVPPGDTSNEAVLVAKHRPGNATGYYLILNKNGDTISAYTGNEPNVPRSTAKVNDGQWHHLVMTHLQGQLTRLYLDGKPTGVAAPALPTLATPGHLYFGAYDVGGAQARFNGFLDDVQFYGFVLSDTQVGYLQQNPGLVVTGEPPRITPNGGRFVDNVTVSLAPGEAGTVVRYTLDGTSPNGSSPAYSAPFLLKDSATVTAVAFRSGFRVGAAATAAFIVDHPQGLLAHWRFDETAGLNAIDDKGLYPGLLSTTGASRVTDGISAGAVSLRSDQNGYVAMTDVLPLTGISHSISLWVRMSAAEAGSVAVLVSKRRVQDLAGGYSLILYPEVNAIFGFTGNSTDFFGALETYTDGKWHHIVMTHAQGGLTRLFFDGHATGATAPSQPTLPTTAGLVFGGFTFVDPVALFTGHLDDVQIYGSALTEAQAEYLHSHPGSELPAGVGLADESSSPRRAARLAGVSGSRELAAELATAANRVALSIQRVSESEFRLRALGNDGEPWVIEYSPDLKHWKVLGGVQANDAGLALPEPTPGDAARYFRATRLQ